MKLAVKLSVNLMLAFSMLVLFSANPAFAKTTRTYFVKVSGNDELGAKLLAELAKKDCFTVSDFGDKTAVDRADECHAFRKFTKNSKIKGDMATMYSSFLYEITVDPPKSFNLQIFQKEGKGMKRIVNAGDFTPSGDYFTALVNTTIGLTFK